MKSFLLPPFLWVCIAWLAPVLCQAQNLVPNPSFEDVNGCPSDLSMFDLAPGWITPSNGSTDLFNTCSQGSFVSVPANLFGHQAPRTGNGYAGIHNYVPTFKYREYAQVKLTKPLTKDSTYHVEFFVSLSNRFRVAINNLGAYLSVEPPRSLNYDLLDNVTSSPQIRNRSGFLTDTLNWMKIEGNFLAAGGEQYLTIGNFYDDAHTSILLNNSDETYAYYYIDDVSVSVATCPIVTDLGPDMVLCPGSSMVLDATSKGATYRWQDGSTQPSCQVGAPGVYWVDVQWGSCSLRDSIEIDYLDQLPSDRFKDTVLCSSSQYLSLDATFPGAIGYRWQDGSTWPSLGVYTTGTYWVDIEFGGCTYRDSIQVQYRDQINKLPDYVSICGGQPVVLDATTEGATYRWQDGSTQPTFIATTPGYYSVAIQTSECTFYDNAQVTYIYTSPVFSSREISLCQGKTMLLDASTVAGPYRWQDGSSESALRIDKPGKYWVEFYSNGCLARDSIQVNELKQLPYDRLKDTILCNNQYYYYIDATFPGAIGYRWQNGSTWPNFGVYTTGTYWVDIEFGGCTYRDSIQVQYRDQINKLPDYVSICGGQPVVLDATTEGATYRWSDGSGESTLTVTTPGYYWVAVEVNNCTFYDYTQVDNYTVPQLFYPREITLCKGQTTQLNASMVAGPYLWDGGSTNSELLVNKPGTYRVKFFWYGCEAYDSVTVHYVDDPPMPFPREIQLCVGETRVLNASVLNSWYYRWNNNHSGSTFRVSQPGTYWVDALWNNCPVRYSTTVSFLPVPVVTIKNDTALCYGRSLVLQVVGANQTFRWQDGSTKALFTVQQPGDYWVEVQDQTTGCVFRKNIQIGQTECWENLVIHNIITPNGDKFNQYFEIDNLTDHWSLEIVNRWGASVYKAAEYHNDWDGSGQVNGVYYYSLRNYVSGQSYRGWVQLLR